LVNLAMSSLQSASPIQTLFAGEARGKQLEAQLRLPPGNEIRR
jgi:hypothetical protein